MRSSMRSCCAGGRLEKCCNLCRNTCCCAGGKRRKPGSFSSARCRSAGDISLCRRNQSPAWLCCAGATIPCLRCCANTPKPWRCARQGEPSRPSITRPADIHPVMKHARVILSVTHFPNPSQPFTAGLTRSCRNLTDSPPRPAALANHPEDQNQSRARDFFPATANRSPPFPPSSPTKYR